MNKTGSLFDLDTEPLTEAAIATSQAERILLTEPESSIDSELPEGWQLVLIANVTKTISNVSPESEADREFGYVDISSIDNDSFRIVGTRRFLGKDAPSRARRPIQSGDVLLSNVRVNLRNTALVEPGIAAELCSTGFTVLRSNGTVDNKYLFRYVLSDAFVNELIPLQTGTQYPATTDRVVLEQKIPLPPLAEQRRIVEAIEANLAHVNAALERLARVPALLKRFRQSVLDAACSGRLTADWREENPNVEPASVLLEQIHTERKVKEGKKYKEPAPVDAIELEELPEGWTWTTFDCACQDITVGFVGSMAKEYRDTGIPFLRSLNIRPFRFDPDQIKYISPDFHDRIRKSKLSAGDVGVVRSGNAGTACVIPEGLGEANCSDLVIVRPANVLNSYFACIFRLMFQ